MRDLAEAELFDLKSKIPELTQAISVALLPKDEADDRSAIRAHAQTLTTRFGVRPATIDTPAANLSGGRLRARFFPVRAAELAADLRAAATGHLAHDDPRRYNAVQKLAYLGVMALTVTIVLSGLVVWKSVQFPWLRTLMGGYDNARVVHFVAMSGLVVFLVVHVVMVALVPRTFVTMIRGR